MASRLREQFSPPQQTAPEIWHTLEEAAVIARRTPTAMRQLRIKGRGPRFRKVDGRLLVSASDLHNWLNGDRQTT
jgi:hypothetical protein